MRILWEHFKNTPFSVLRQPPLEVFFKSKYLLVTAHRDGVKTFTIQGDTSTVRLFQTWRIPMEDGAEMGRFSCTGAFIQRAALKSARAGTTSASLHNSLAAIVTSIAWCRSQPYSKTAYASNCGQFPRTCLRFRMWTVPHLVCCHKLQGRQKLSCERVPVLLCLQGKPVC